MDENNKKAYWHGAIEIFTQVSGWIVAPIVFALIFGKMLDTHYGTKPIIFLSFAGIGFIFTCVGITRVVKKYIKKIQNQSNLGTGQVKDLEKK